MANETRSKLVQRILLILGFLEDLQHKHPNRDIFDLHPQDFSRLSPILTDYRNLEPVFERIAKDTEGVIAVSIREHRGHASDPTDPTAAVGLSVTITARIDDPKEISRYRNELKRDKHPKSEEITFVLSERSNKAILRIRGDESGKECAFMRKPQRYQILKYLIDAKGPVPTKALEKKFGLEGQEVRGEIADIRKRISKAFGIETESLLPNTPGDGYSFLNIEVGE